MGAFALAAALGAAFVRRELVATHPMLDVRILRRPGIAGSVLAVMLSSLGMMGSMFFLSQYLQSVVGFTTIQTGLGIIQLAVAMAVASPISAFAARRIGARTTVAAGLAAVAAGLVVLTRATPASGYPIVALSLALLGAGTALAATPVTTLMIQAMPASKAGVASAINSSARELGGALGVAILGSIAAPVYAAGVGGATRILPADAAAAVSDSLPGAVAVAGHLPAGVADVLLALARSAFVDGMTAAVATGAAVALGGAALALAFLPGRERSMREPAAVGPRRPDEPLPEVAAA